MKIKVSILNLLSIPLYQHNLNNQHQFITFHLKKKFRIKQSISSHILLKNLNKHFKFLNYQYLKKIHHIIRKCHLNQLLCFFFINRIFF